jgi:hypothetical protein
MAMCKFSKVSERSAQGTKLAAGDAVEHAGFIGTMLTFGIRKIRPRVRGNV